MKISRIKNQISEAATEACGYSPLTKVVSEEEINRILEQESGWIPVSERLPEESLNSVIGWDTYRNRCCFVAAVRSMTGFWKKNKRNFQNGGFGGFSVVIFKMRKASVEVLNQSFPKKMAIM